MTASIVQFPRSRTRHANRDIDHALPLFLRRVAPRGKAAQCQVVKVSDLKDLPSPWWGSNRSVSMRHYRATRFLEYLRQISIIFRQDHATCVLERSSDCGQMLILMPAFFAHTYLVHFGKSTLPQAREDQNEQNHALRPSQLCQIPLKQSFPSWTHRNDRKDQKS